MVKDEIKSLISEALSAQGLSVPEIHMEHPDVIDHGDYATNVALVIAKSAGKSPKQVALALKSEIDKSLPSEVERIEIAGPGFLNFFLSRQFYAQSIQDVLDDKYYGNGNAGNGKKVVVEYSSPNIAKPFTIGHLRSTIIGDAVANILSSQGYEVIRDNHLGDWGTQFGKQIVAIEKWGSVDELRNSDNKMRYLVDLYVRFHDEAEKDNTIEDAARKRFADLESGDESARTIYEETITASKEYFNSIYSRLGTTKFDTELGESFFTPWLSKAEAALNEKSLLKESEGATLVFFPEDKYPPLMIKKSDGTSLYATRDLATDLYRLETYGKDVLIVNEVGGEQTLYFRQLFETERMLGWVKEGQRVHVAHGLYRFKEGKMSTRKGNVVWLEEVIDEAIERAKAIKADTAKDVAIGALKFNDLRRESSQDIVFDWDEILNLKGDSGPYLQYANVRSIALLAKAEEAGIKVSTNNPSTSVSILEKLLYRFPEIVKRSACAYAPHYIATYLIELSGAFNRFYAEGQIVGDTPDSPYKLAVTKAFGQVMEKGLSLLGIPVLQKM